MVEQRVPMNAPFSITGSARLVLEMAGVRQRSTGLARDQLRSTDEATPAVVALRVYGRPDPVRRRCGNRDRRRHERSLRCRWRASGRMSRNGSGGRIGLRAASRNPLVLPRHGRVSRVMHVRVRWVSCAGLALHLARRSGLRRVALPGVASGESVELWREGRRRAALARVRMSLCRLLLHLRLHRLGCTGRLLELRRQLRRMPAGPSGAGRELMAVSGFLDGVRLS